MVAQKKYTRKEVAEQETTDTVFIFENVVYNATEYLGEHPGGHEPLVKVKGKDATEYLNDIGHSHSLEARELMHKYRVGELVDEDKTDVREKQISWGEDGSKEQRSKSFFSSLRFPVVLGILVTVVYSYLFG